MQEVAMTQGRRPRAALGTAMVPGGAHRSVLLVDDVILDLAAALTSERAIGPWEAGSEAQRWLRDPSRLELFLAMPAWADLVSDVSTRWLAGSVPDDVARWSEDEVVQLSPVSQPQKIVAVGLNYQTHVDEASRERPDYPVLFAKFANTLTGACDDVPIPRASHRIDYEGELAVVVGRTASWIDAADADRYVAGVCVANDVSARDYQFRTKEMLQGKTFDKFCPLGPWLVDPGPLDALRSRRLTTTVNGEQRQSALLGEMIFDVPTLLEYISQVMTLQPGDVVLTGTPGGIGAGMSPRRWLRDGDVVEIEIEGVGRMTNRFVTENPVG
jgi:acylpyruvate hydrolase